MRDLYLIRHGKPQYPDEHSYCIGQTNLPLSMLGHLQAVLLHEALSDKISAIYCSPLSRVVDTAKHIAPALPHLTVSELSERNLGSWDGLSFDEICQKWPVIYEARGRNPEYPIPGAETPLESGTRFSQAISRILHSSDGNIAIVAHTDVISSYLWMLHPEISERQKFRLPCGSYYHLRMDTRGNAALSDSHYILPHPDLNDELCQMLRDSVDLPQHVQAHSDAVTELACRLCDILKVHGYLFDQKLIRSGALLHDIARLQKHHTRTGGDLFLQLGYPEISQIISQHHGLKETKLDEVAIVFLADKLIEETQRVSIEKRFADNLHKCKSPEAIKSHERQLNQALALQDMIQSICHTTL